jgi:hypothetical protein
VRLLAIGAAAGQRQLLEAGSQDAREGLGSVRRAEEERAFARTLKGLLAMASE